MRKILFILLLIGSSMMAQRRFIVLTKPQVEFLDTFKLRFIDSLNYYGVDFIPIPIKDSLYILPLQVLSDWRFGCVYRALNAGHHFDNMLIRDVEETEFIHNEN